jgi:hypothetical protein
MGLEIGINLKDAADKFISLNNLFISSDKQFAKREARLLIAKLFESCWCV